MLYDRIYHSAETDSDKQEILTKENIQMAQEGYKKDISLVKARLGMLINDKGCLMLLSAFLQDYGLEFVECVGSATHHHKGIGGNLTHTLQVLNICEKTAQAFPLRVNKDIMFTGAFLHDIGKMFCYDEKEDNTRRRKTGEIDGEGNPVYTYRPKDPFKQSEKAKDMGHFGEAIRLLTRLIDKYEIPLTEEQEDAIFHIISSHHGEHRLNWGSITDPNTIEAYIVFMADYLSAKVE